MYLEPLRLYVQKNAFPKEIDLTIMSSVLHSFYETFDLYRGACDDDPLDLLFFNFFGHRNRINVRLSLLLPQRIELINLRVFLKFSVASEDDLLGMTVLYSYQPDAFLSEAALGHISW